MKTVVFLTKKGTGPSQKAQDLIVKEFGNDTDIISGYNLLDPEYMIKLIDGLKESNELICILVSVIGEGLYILESDNTILNLKKLIINTSNVYDSAVGLAHQLTKEEK